MPPGPPGPRRMPHRGAPGDPGPVHQPRHRAGSPPRPPRTAALPSRCCGTCGGPSRYVYWAMIIVMNGRLARSPATTSVPRQETSALAIRG